MHTTNLTQTGLAVGTAEADIKDASFNKTQLQVHQLELPIRSNSLAINIIVVFFFRLTTFMPWKKLAFMCRFYATCLAVGNVPRISTKGM